MLIKAKDVPTSVGLAGNLTVGGKIIRVFERKTGVTNGINWAFQNIILKDDTGEMTVSLRNREEIKTTEVDKTISFASRETKNGILGVKVEKEDYKDKEGNPKSAIKVIITKSAQMTYSDSTAVKSDTPPDVHHEEPKQDIDLEALRKESIKISLDAWKEALKEELAEDSSGLKPVHYAEIMNAMILAAGRNADTYFIARKE